MKFRIAVTLVASAVLALAGAGCAQEEPTIEVELEESAASARQDLATRLEVGSENVDIVEAISVVWRDSSAGCPDPDMNYLQALTPGSRVRLQVEETEYFYHASGAAELFFCDSESRQDPLEPE